MPDKERRTQQPSPPQNGEPPLSGEEVRRLLIDVAKIHPPIEKAMRKIFHLTTDYQILNEEINRPAVAEFVRDNPDVATIARLGFYSRILLARQDLKTQADAFLSESRYHYSTPAVVKRYRRDEDLANYIRRYRSLPGTIKVVCENLDSQVAGWMSRQVPAAELYSENRFVEAAPTQQVGDMLLNFAIAREKKGRPQLNSIEYADLVELFVPVVTQERRQTGQITITETAVKELLSRIFFDLVLAYELKLTPQQIKAIPPFLQAAVKQGIPLYNLFYDFIRELPVALSHADHPGHIPTLGLVDVLNTFDVETRTRDHELGSQMFNYHLAAGMMEFDFNGMANFQEFVYFLEGLVNRHDQNEQRYQQLLDYFLKASRFFAYKAVCSVEDLHLQLFDPQRTSPRFFEVGTRIESILEHGNYSNLSLLINSELYPIENTALRGDGYTSFFYIERVAPGEYEISMELLTENKPEVPQNEQIPVELTKFRCQIKVKDNQLTIFLPVVQKERMHPEVELMITQHLRHMLSLVDPANIQFAEDETNSTTQTGYAPGKKNGDRQDRMKTYQQEKAANGEGRNGDPHKKKGMKLTIAHSPETQIVAAPETEVNVFLPQKLFFSYELWEAIKNQGPKGKYARIYRDIKHFVGEYNRATKDKPGRGTRLTEVRGGRGEAVWRFKPNKQIRCIVVEVGDGSGMVIDVDDRPSAYDDATEMRSMVDAALGRYEERQRQKDKPNGGNGSGK